MKWTSQRRALSTAGGAFALSLVLASPASAAVQWHLQYELDRAEENEFVDVDAAAVDDVWAVGSTGPWDDTTPVAFHYDGDTWQEVESPQVDVEFTGVDATSSGTAWLAVDDTDSSGGDDAVMQWDGESWRTHSFPGSARGDVAAVTDDDVWFVSGTADGTGVARHYDGDSWQTTQLPGAGPDSISNVEARSGDDIWAVGTRDDQPYAAHWNGTRWRVLSPDAVTPPPGEDEFSAWLSDVGFVGDTAWAVGMGTGDDSAQGLLYRFDGETWKRKKLPAMEFGVGASDVGTGPNGKLWLAGEDGNLMYRKTADGWAEVALPERPGTATGIDAFSATGTTAYAVGTAELDDFEYHGVIYRGVAG